jgi:membrane-associated protease RseP (regulator of RpoE activity)
LALVPLGLIGAFGIGVIVVTLWHELGHLYMARLLRIPVKQIAVGLGPELWRRSLGKESTLVVRAVPTGMAIGVPGRFDDEGHLRRPVMQDILMAAGGPAASCLITLIFLLLAVYLPGQPAVQLWLIFMGLFSVVLAILNLVPFPGLDGGHLLILVASLLGLRFSPEQESAFHRAGVRLLAALSILSLFVALARSLL